MLLVSAAKEKVKPLRGALNLNLKVHARTTELYNISERTNVPGSSEHTWTPFHHLLHIKEK